MMIIGVTSLMGLTWIGAMGYYIRTNILKPFTPAK